MLGIKWNEFLTNAEIHQSSATAYLQNDPEKKMHISAP